MSARSPKRPAAKTQENELPAVVQQALQVANMQNEITKCVTELRKVNARATELTEQIKMLHADKRVAEILLKQESDKNTLE